MDSVRVYKDGVYRLIAANQLAEYKERGFMELDESGKPKKADSKAQKEAMRLTAELDEAKAKIVSLTAELDEAKKK